MQNNLTQRLGTRGFALGEAPASARRLGRDPAPLGAL